MRFGFVPRGQVNPPPVILKFSRHYYTFSPTQMFMRFGFTPRGTVTPTPPPVKIIDTHDAVKKKKKKKQRDFTEEIDRRKKIREQIEEVIHPTPEILPPLKPERVPEEVTIIEPLRVYRSLETIDYAGLARDEIVAKLKSDAILKAKQYQEEIKRIELKRIADEEEEEEELMMILDAIL